MPPERVVPATTKMQVKPCFHTMARQTANQVDMYARRPSPGDTLPTLINLVAVNNDVPSDGKICHAACCQMDAPLTRLGCLLRMYMHGYPAFRKRKILKHRTTPPQQVLPHQLLWSIIVLIRKGGRDFHGIGLLKPNWKVLEQVMGLRLDSIELHNTFHEFHAHRGMGTAVVKAKLVQQLS